MIRKLRQTIAIFLLLSLFIHLGFVASFVIRAVKPLPPRPVPVEVNFVTPEEVKKMIGKKPPPPKINMMNQIVEQKDKINDEVDKNSRFLSAHNQKVLQQTKAAQSGKFNNTAQGGKTSEGSKTAEKTTEKEHKKLAADKERGELPALKDLAPKFSLNPGPKAPETDKNGDPSQSDDYLKDVNTGLQTLLSTREFVYYSYYSRIKEAIRQHWEPNVREKVKIIYRQGRSIASATDRVTQVLVVLNNKGELIRVDILTQSGVESLDNAAVEAFKAAAPFPNPPKGMVESDGTIKIRWDFVLEA